MAVSLIGDGVPSHASIALHISISWKYRQSCNLILTSPQPERAAARFRDELCNTYGSHVDHKILIFHAGHVVRGDGKHEFRMFALMLHAETQYASMLEIFKGLSDRNVAIDDHIVFWVIKHDSEVEHDGEAFAIDDEPPHDDLLSKSNWYGPCPFSGRIAIDDFYQAGMA
jgi:hypothetical protein